MFLCMFKYGSRCYREPDAAVSLKIPRAQSEQQDHVGFRYWQMRSVKCLLVAFRLGWKGCGDPQPKSQSFWTATLRCPADEFWGFKCIVASSYVPLFASQGVAGAPALLLQPLQSLFGIVSRLPKAGWSQYLCGSKRTGSWQLRLFFPTEDVKQCIAQLHSIICRSSPFKVQMQYVKAQGDEQVQCYIHTHVYIYISRRVHLRL